ncbi:hypothetical protein FOA52_011530 [Chlamydomonas sp. UWO 241]|nr:hypothetical protein FOA52_011530 [Chlamydomonas sp. UWO 241]
MGPEEEAAALGEAVVVFVQAGTLARLQVTGELEAAFAGDAGSSGDVEGPGSSHDALVLFWVEQGLDSGAATRLVRELAQEDQAQQAQAQAQAQAQQAQAQQQQQQQAQAQQQQQQQAQAQQQVQVQDARSAAGPAASASGGGSDDASSGPQQQPAVAASNNASSVPRQPAADAPSSDSSGPQQRPADAPPAAPPSQHTSQLSTNQMSAKLSRLRRILPGVDVVALVAADPRVLSCSIEGALLNMIALVEGLPGKDVVSLVSSRPRLLWLDDVRGRLAKSVGKLMSVHPSGDARVVTDIIADNPGLLWRIPDYYMEARLIDEFPIEIQNMMVLSDAGIGFLHKYWKQQRKEQQAAREAAEGGP